MITENEIKKAFHEARKEAINTYPEYEYIIYEYKLEFSYKIYNDDVLAKTCYNNNIFNKRKIVVYMPEVNRENTSTKIYKDAYNLLLHEFAHVIQRCMEPYSESHGKEFREISIKLGMKNPKDTLVSTAKRRYILSVPSEINGRITTYYATKEWLDDNPEYKQYMEDEFIE